MSSLRELRETGWTALLSGDDILVVEEWRDGREHYRFKHALPWLGTQGDWTPMNVGPLADLLDAWAADVGGDDGCEITAGRSIYGGDAVCIGQLRVWPYDDESGRFLEGAGHVDRENAREVARYIRRWASE